MSLHCPEQIAGVALTAALSVCSSMMDEHNIPCTESSPSSVLQDLFPRPFGNWGDVAEVGESVQMIEKNEIKFPAGAFFQA